jgi:hypothetical protein
VDGHGAEILRHGQVDGVRRAGAQQVAEILDHHVGAGQLLQADADMLADAAELLVAVGVGLALFDDVLAGFHRAFGDDADRVIGRVGAAVAAHQFGEPFQLEGTSAISVRSASAR